MKNHRLCTHCFNLMSGCKYGYNLKICEPKLMTKTFCPICYNIKGNCSCKK